VFPNELYVDLLIKVVANTIYEDPNQNPKKDLFYDRKIRSEGRDWPLIAHSMIGLERLSNIKELCAKAIQENILGDFVETGVWRGGACILMRGILEAFGVEDRVVFCCDSFEGLPRPDPELYPADSGDRHHEKKQLAVSLDEVKGNFAKYGLLDSKTKFVKGFFKDTLHNLNTKTIAVLRLDGDMYESTVQALVALYDKVSIGGYVIIDDYGAVPGCKLAVENFLKSREIEVKLNHIDWTGVWWQKE